jgi:hypothetical protein
MRFAFDETLGGTVRDARRGAASFVRHQAFGHRRHRDDRRQADDGHARHLPKNWMGGSSSAYAAQELIVELYKPRGRRVELAVEAGSYDVRIEREKSALSARTTITRRLSHRACRIAVWCGGDSNRRSRAAGRR